MPGEGDSLLNSSTVEAATAIGSSVVDTVREKIKQAQNGDWTFRILGFIGGLAMILSNFLQVFDRFFSFNLSGAVIALYNILFGAMIAALDAPADIPFTANVRRHILAQAKCMETAIGRGALYIFVGTLQLSNMNLLDWAVGGFMVFVGVTAVTMGAATAKKLKLLKFSLRDEASTKAKWEEHDADKNGTLDVKELTAFITDAGIEMNRNEVAAAFLAMDKNFDEKIAYEEFFVWWATEPVA